MFHKYLSDIIKKERCYFPNWFRKIHLEEYLDKKVSQDLWDEFIEWHESYGNMEYEEDLLIDWKYFLEIRHQDNEFLKELEEEE